MAVGDAHVFPGFLTPVLTQLFFPKPPTTFLTCFCRGERRKYVGKKSHLNRGSNSQPPGHESDTLTTEPPGRGAIERLICRREMSLIGSTSFSLHKIQYMIFEIPYWTHRSIVFDKCHKNIVTNVFSFTCNIFYLQGRNNCLSCSEFVTCKSLWIWTSLNFFVRWWRVKN